ncbi:Transcription factor bHLH94 like [Actinidia chinensis var. chinensis]|uniref:Transcription factor bHLH94 like n=1 Tax=Actinidia chinensis var. chinensis TaxID=1590841 RepID=A0A2R6QL72_ACTCC|nr:Transcription factor bHLH94 like [Actinidia chinensis var. chinensis]
MALEAVVVQQGHFGYTTKDLYTLFGGNWGCDFSLPENENFLENQTENSSQYWNFPVPPSLIVPSLDNTINPEEELCKLDTSLGTVSTRAKRRRSKGKKNKEEMENQRMTHIAVERNRRKQMNEYLSVLRGLMPHSYLQKGDQASIIGGAINYVKELEQKLHFLGGRKHVNNQKFEAGSSSSLPFDELFTFPQYTTSSDSSIMVSSENHELAMADIEVTMVETHARLKIRSKRRPKQLLKVVSGLQSLRLTILHLNVNTVDQIVLYSLSLKVEDDCKLTSVDEIATAVNQMLGRIQQEAVLL